jgi:hypothetical protein
MQRWNLCVWSLRIFRFKLLKPGWFHFSNGYGFPKYFFAIVYASRVVITIFLIWFYWCFIRLAFEALCCGSWQSVELIQIRDGAMTVHFVDSHHRIEEKGPFSNVRVKSRKATSSDCTCFLRPGIDVCVLSSSERAKNTGEGNSEPVSDLFMLLHYWKLCNYERTIDGVPLSQSCLLSVCNCLHFFRTAHDLNMIEKVLVA